VARVVVITGAARSGKSHYAQTMAEALPGPRVFVATCPLVDEEMRERIKKHQQARSKSNWVTVEETLDLTGTLRNQAGFRLILVDCLTLWVSNLMHRAHEHGQEVGEEEVAESCREILEVCSTIPGTVLFVTNEVGAGIVPENPVARLYRDLVGRCNQVIAAGADQVVLMVAGLPLELKETDDL